MSSTCTCNASTGFLRPRSPRSCLAHRAKFKPEDAVSIWGVCVCGTSDCLDLRQKQIEQNPWRCAPFGKKLLCMRWHVRRTGSASYHCIDWPALSALWPSKLHSASQRRTMLLVSTDSVAPSSGSPADGQSTTPATDHCKRPAWQGTCIQHGQHVPLPVT